MICIPAPTTRLATSRSQITPSSVDFAAREEVISRLEADYDQSLEQIEELSARLEACLAMLTGKPTIGAAATTAEPAANERKAA
jgi:hypothetical protein